MAYIIGRFYYDKSTKTLYKYSHDRLEIKDIRCIHQGIERERKKKDIHINIIPSITLRAHCYHTSLHKSPFQSLYKLYYLRCLELGHCDCA